MSLKDLTFRPSRPDLERVSNLPKQAGGMPCRYLGLARRGQAVQREKFEELVAMALSELPAEFQDRLENVDVVVQDYPNHTVALTEYNANNQELRKLNTHGSCCEFSWTDYLGVLPDGGWTICPASLEAFGNIFANSLEEIIEFKRGLSLHYEEGCTECLKDFKDFRKEFETNRATKELGV